MSRTVIIAGPTGSGKSGLAVQLAQQHSLPPGRICNADSAQMYTPLAIGTAKPDLAAQTVPHHLFDLLSAPHDYDVVLYKDALKPFLKDSDASINYIVGGSLFYIKSLFMPPHTGADQYRDEQTALQMVAALKDDQWWDTLHQVDPVRAAAIHHNDHYRLGVALKKFYMYNVPPSQLKPLFNPIFTKDNHVTVIFLNPPSDILYPRLNKRTEEMIHNGWIDEAIRLHADIAWRQFIERKGFIGYRELFTWIDAGKKRSELSAVIAAIQQKTRQYAKRQKTFWRSFCQELENNRDKVPGSFHTLSDFDRFMADAEKIIAHLQ